jgi:hypothetical protein
MDLAERVLLTAKSQRIHPRARIWFVLARLGIAILFLLTVVLGALAFGLSLEALFPENSGMLMGKIHGFHGEGMHRGHGGGGFLRMTLGWLPLFWILFVSGMTAISYWVFRNFRYGYRTRPSRIILSTILTSLIIGSVCFQFHLTFRIHRNLMQHVSTYRSLFDEQRRNQWTKASQGRLSGIVLSVDGTNFHIRDWNGQTWIVFSKQAPLLSDTVRVLGEICGTDFCSQQIIPWNHLGQKK